MTFPFISGKEDFTAQDFIRFELQFSKTVLDLLPCRHVSFFFLTPEQEGLEEEFDCSETWSTGIMMVRQQQQPVVDHEGLALFLPVWDNTQLVAVAVLNGGSQDLYGKYTSEWLLERSYLASREFRKIKQWSVDPLTGLLNSVHLRAELELLQGTSDEVEPVSDGSTEITSSWFLFLIEVYSRSQDAGQSLQSISRVGAYLDSLVGDFASVHHLGVGVFALLWHGKENEEIQKLGYAILRKIKRQNIAKAHIGIAPLHNQEHADEPPGGIDESETVLQFAWDALKAARQRGVFALCSKTTIGSSQQPIALPPKDVVSQFTKLWRRRNIFSIVFLQKDLNDLDHFPAKIQALAGEDSLVIPIAPHEAYVFLPGYDEDAAAKWSEKMFARMKELGVGTFSAGIATYPCPGFKKLDVLQNARKALLHTNFLGLGTVTSFNAVSLNISGDVYYNDGDLVTAIKEYSLGLNLDPDNINLLNSLGVIYAQIDKQKKAIPLFERVLQIDSKDFMALYNLGFAHLNSGNREQALLNFEKAMAVDDSYFDLLLQIGQLYCRSGSFKKAVKVLSKAEKTVAGESSVPAREPWERCEPWHHTNNQLGHGLVYRFLGEAYKGINKNKEAMAYLQRAARYNSKDAYALSLLGEIYAREKQGDEIALSLCSQAVELDDSNESHWFRLAYVRFHCKEYELALDALHQSLNIAPSNIEAMMLLARVFVKMGMQAKARRTYEKVLRQDGTNRQAAKALKKLNRT